MNLNRILLFYRVLFYQLILYTGCSSQAENANRQYVSFEYLIALFFLEFEVVYVHDPVIDLNFGTDQCHVLVDEENHSEIIFAIQIFFERHIKLAWLQ